MQQSCVDDLWKSTHLVDNLGDVINKRIDGSDVGLVSAFNKTLAKGWVNGQASLHVHIRVGLVGEAITDEFCFLFQRKGQPTETFFQQDSVRVPSDSLSDFCNISKVQLSTQGLVFIHVGESFDHCEKRENALIWLRPLDDCPRIPIDLYPVKNTALWLLLSELDFLK